MSVKDNLYTLRKERNLSQEQMAERLGMSKNGYGKLERGESRLTIEHLEQIATVFNIDIVELLRGDSDLNLMIVGDNHSHCTNTNCSHGNKQEMEKLQLIINHKDELLSQKDKEIELLRRLLGG